METLDDIYYGKTEIARLTNGIVETATNEGYIANLSIEEVPDSKVMKVSFFWKPTTKEEKES
jgi:hypothetical protein